MEYSEIYTIVPLQRASLQRASLQRARSPGEYPSAWGSVYYIHLDGALSVRSGHVTKS